MNETAFEAIASAASVLKLDFSSEEFAGFVEDHGLFEAAIEAVKAVFSLFGTTGTACGFLYSKR